MRRRASLIATTTITVVLLAAIYVVLARPQFAATSEVMLDPRKSSVENSAAVLSNLPADQPTILNQIEILTSHRFAGKVVDRLHLDSDPDFANAGLANILFGADSDRREIAITRLRNILKVAQAGFSSTIRITVTMRDRQKAATIAATVAELYVAEQLDTKTTALHQARTWLTQRVGELARQVRDAEAAVQKYKADHNITITSDGTSILEKQVADLSTQLTVARTEYDDKASKAGRTTELMKSNQLTTAPQVIASPLINTLRTQQSEINREIANLATRYGPNHPKMKELLSQRGDIETKIGEEASRIAESVRNDAESSRTHVASLEKGIRQIEDQSAKKNQEAVELTGLQSAAASTRALYLSFLTQYSQTENQQGILRPDAYVISASDVSETFGPQTKLLAVLSAIPAGLLLGLALAFLAERGSAVPQTAAPRGFSGSSEPSPQPAALLPEAAAGQWAADLVATNPQSPFAAAVSHLLNSALATVTPPGTIMITAMTPGAGKTTLALALARNAARAGIRTIVIDADHHALHLADMIGQTAARTNGPATGQSEIDRFINPDPLSTALVMASSPRQRGYSDLLVPPVLARLIADLKITFELVVVAAPVCTDDLAHSLLPIGDITLVAVDARRPAPSLRLPRRALAVFTHVR